LLSLLIQKQAASTTSHDPDATMASEPSLSTLAEQAAAAASSIASSSAGPSSLSFEAEEHLRTKEQIRRHYVRTLHKVIEQSDIVIQVLDARDPEGCRSRLVEEEVRRREHEGKKLVFVLNKIGTCIHSHPSCSSTPILSHLFLCENQRLLISLV
jgi:nuclear GTP-binding protein